MKPEARSRWVVKLDFVGANRDVRPSGEEKTEAIISYFRGSPEDWKTGLSTYSRVVYRDLWPGIDLVYYGTTDRLKYEFIVHPGADPSEIRLAYRGTSEVDVNEEGRLEVETPVGGFEDDVPVAWQEVDGKKVEVAISYELGGDVAAGASETTNLAASIIGTTNKETDTAVHAYGFHVADYDKTQTLVLDPAVLVYCGYIGGSGDDYGYGIAVDSAGNAYVTGGTSSTEASFPVTAGPDLTYNGGSTGGVGDAFVAKVNSTGTALVYCGYIGGSGSDKGNGIAVDSAGNAYVTGYTAFTQATFPETVGPDLTYNGGDADAFVAKISSFFTKNDFNGDGQEDILWRYYGSGGKNCIWYMQGATRIGSAILTSAVPGTYGYVLDLNWQIGGTGDFNGDGWPDILWRYNGSGGINRVWYMQGATRTGTASLGAVTDLNWQIGGTGDFNGDGWPDILWRYNGSGGKDVVWYMKGSTRTGSASLPAVTDLNWKIGGAGDFNGDGWPDILWRYYGSGGKNCVWYMKGATRTGSASLPAIIDLNWQIENH